MSVSIAAFAADAVVVSVEAVGLAADDAEAVGVDVVAVEVRWE